MDISRVHGIGHRKTPQQRHYERLQEYVENLEEYGRTDYHLRS